MYARVTSFKVVGSRLGEVPAKLKEMASAAKALPGIVDVYVAWRADGRGVVTAVYNSKGDADAAAPKIQSLWAALGSLLEGAPSTEAYDMVDHMVG
jgi:hypothetical protein